MGKPDTYKDIDSIKEWDYYNNGENPNTREYRTILWNCSIFHHRENIFQGDISKERLDFLVKLSSHSRFTTFLISMKRDVPYIFIAMGKIYEIGFNPLYLEKLGEHFCLKSFDKNYSNSHIVTKLMNFYVPKIRKQESE